MPCRQTGGDARPWEERGCLYACSQSLLHGADQTAAELVSHTLKRRKQQQKHAETGLYYAPGVYSNSALYLTWRFVCLCSASDNIPKADEIRTLVKDIWDTRVAKLRLSADSFISQLEAHAKVQLMAKHHTLSIKLPHIFKEYWMAETISQKIDSSIISNGHWRLCWNNASTLE